jgi:hypothetical protein
MNSMDGANDNVADFKATAEKLIEVLEGFLGTNIEGGEVVTPAQAERMAPLLLASAEAVYRSRRKRSAYFADALFGEPAWDMLLDLFIHQVRRKRVQVTSACLASGVPATTALRWITVLEQEGLVQRVPGVQDKRIQFVELTKAGYLAVARWLAHRVRA